LACCYTNACVPLVDDVVVATTTKVQDQQIADYCRQIDCDVSRGSEEDVLERYYETAKERDAEQTVRITSDCLLLSPEVTNRVIRIFNESSAEFVSNKDPYTHPIGLQAEVMTFEALSRMQEQAISSKGREHVTRYIRRSDKFEKRTVKNLLDTSHYSDTDDNTVLRWVVDYQSDLNFIRAIYHSLASDCRQIFGQHSVFELLERRPDLVSMTTHAMTSELKLE